MVVLMMVVFPPHFTRHLAAYVGSLEMVKALLAIHMQVGDMKIPGTRSH